MMTSFQAPVQIPVLTTRDQIAFLYDRSFFAPAMGAKNLHADVRKYTFCVWFSLNAEQDFKIVTRLLAVPF